MEEFYFVSPRNYLGWYLWEIKRKEGVLLFLYRTVFSRSELDFWGAQIEQDSKGNLSFDMNFVLEKIIYKMAPLQTSISWFIYI